MKEQYTIKTKETLLDNIKRHNELYRKGTPEISDAEYDAEIEQLRKLDPDSGWFKHIEPASVSTGRKVSLPIPMKSLNKAKSLGEVIKWCKSLGLTGRTEVICMPKFDGLSLLVNELTGMAYSRGGAENEGQDCSKHIMAANIMKDAHYRFTFGEFIISNENWDKFFKDKFSPSTGEKFKSPRNTAAGMLNADEPNNLIQHASLYRYGIGQSDLVSYITYEQVIKELCEAYKQQPLFHKCKVEELTEESLKDLFSAWSNGYPIDGVVIYINDLAIWDKVGRHETTGNPLYAIAYKHPDFTSAFHTTVKSITWKVSKAGALKPVVNIETVDTGDCEMENPTGYNAAFIKTKQLAKGAEILVTRSGGVIPKILSTIKPAASEEQTVMWSKLSICPSCGAPTAWNGTMVELCCTNPDCPGRKLAKIIHFFTVLGAENMGEESYVKLFEAGFDSIKKILNITPKEILAIDGFGDSTVNIILQNNKKALEETDAATLMHASDCFEGIGLIKARKILSEMGGFIDLFYQKKYIPMSSPGDSKTYRSFCDGIKPFYKFLETNGLELRPSEKKEIKSNGKCAGLKVCFTGIRDKELEDTIIQEGGEIVSGVSRKTTNLIVADLSSNSSKMQKAKELVIAIDTIELFRSKHLL